LLSEEKCKEKTEEGEKRCARVREGYVGREGEES
jgi:hypothetical protein